MRAKELRIGNLVLATTAGNVGGMADYAIENGKDIDNAHWFFPIPLTEEWLINFGAEFIGENETHSGYRLNDVIVRYYFVEKLVSIDLGQFELSVKYVHSLQNFFALIDNELKINN